MLSEPHYPVRCDGKTDTVTRKDRTFSIARVERKTTHNGILAMNSRPRVYPPGVNTRCLLNVVVPVSVTTKFPSKEATHFTTPRSRRLKAIPLSHELIKFPRLHILIIGSVGHHFGRKHSHQKPPRLPHPLK